MRNNPSWRSILLHPWVPIDLKDEKPHHVFQSDEFFMVIFYFNFFAALFLLKKILQDGRIPDILPESEAKMSRSVLPDGVVKIFADDDQFIDRLKKIKIQKVSRLEDADVVWWRAHFHDYKWVFLIVHVSYIPGLHWRILQYDGKFSGLSVQFRMPKLEF